MLIHGEKKIGKTTLASEGGRVLFFQCDPKQRSYRRLEVHLPDWATFLAGLKALEANFRSGNKLQYERVVLDGADTWYRLCMNYTCTKLGIEHPSDEDWGKGYDAVRQEFSKAVDRLLALPCGVWFIAHSHWKPIETRNSKRKIDKLVPLLGKMPEEVLNGKVDAWLAYDYSEEQRVLVIQGSEQIGAGHRLDQPGNPHFRHRETGEPLTEISMGSSAAEAYANLVAAFSNMYPIATAKPRGVRVAVRK